MQTVISTRDLGLSYRDHEAVLSGVDLEIRRGEFWFLLGPNGSGKTTLLRSLLGDLRPRVGEVRLDRAWASRDRIGFVPQRCDLNPSLPTTVREFVSLGLVGLDVRRADRPERLDWALSKVGLSDLRQRSYWALSGGQRQRALVARALVRRPGLLILDEPTVGLDLPGTEALLESLDELHRGERLTILFVTHHLTSAARHATHVALFIRGRVVSGPVEEILTSKHLEEAYQVPVHVREIGDGTRHVWLERGP